MEEHEWKFIPRLIVLDSTDEDGFLKKWIRFKGKEKKFVSPTYFFLISIYTCWNNVILGGDERSGE